MAAEKTQMYKKLWCLKTTLRAAVLMFCIVFYLIVLVGNIVSNFHITLLWGEIVSLENNVICGNCNSSIAQGLVLSLGHSLCDL